MRAEELMRNKLSSGWGIVKKKGKYVQTYDPFGYVGCKNIHEMKRNIDKMNFKLEEGNRSGKKIAV